MDAFYHPHTSVFFIEKIVNDALEEQNREVIMDSKTIIYLRFVDNIYSLAEEENKLENLMKSLDKSAQSRKWR